MEFETFDDALKWRRHDRKKLLIGSKSQRRVSHELNKCRVNKRCQFESCPVCMHEFRIEWAGEVTKIMLQRPEWTRCTVIPAGFLVPYGQLRTFDVDTVIKALRRRIQRSALQGLIVLGGLDLSLTIDGVIIGWQFRLHLLVEGHNDADLQQAVRDSFAPEPTARVPYGFVEVTDLVAAASYVYAAKIKRRSFFVGKDGKDRSKAKPLKGADIRELPPFLAKYKVGARIILYGVRRNGQRLAFTRRKT